MTVPDQPVAVPAPSELRVDANRMINILQQRLLEEISKAAMFEAALADAQDREQQLARALHQAQETQQDAAAPKSK